MLTCDATTRIRNQPTHKAKYGVVYLMKLILNTINVTSYLNNVDPEESRRETFFILMKLVTCAWVQASLLT